MNSHDVGDKVRIKGRFGTNPTHILNEAPASSTSVAVADVTGYATGDTVIVNPGMDTQELNTVNTITGRVLGMSSAWIHPHHIRERIWERTDPTTVTLKVKGPSGTTAAYVYSSGDVTKDAVGMYSKDISLSSAGTYYYKWLGTGAAETAGEGQFTVRPSAFAT
jgi:hypothetical protein